MYPGIRPSPRFAMVVYRSGETDVLYTKFLPITPPNRRSIRPSRTPRRRRRRALQRPQIATRHPPLPAVRRPHDLPDAIVRVLARHLQDLEHVAADQTHVDAVRGSRRLGVCPIVVGHPQSRSLVAAGLVGRELVHDFDGGELVCCFEGREFVDCGPWGGLPRWVGGWCMLGE
jgi:hypothetical protein